MKTYLILPLLFCCIMGIAQTNDNPTEQYDINDPRNPNCPCHEYQQQADQEYQQLTANNISNIQVQENNLNQANSSFHTSYNYQESTTGKKTKTVNLKKLHRSSTFSRKDNVRAKRTKGRRNNACLRCFKW